jgi:hypothetical protein
MDLEDVLRIEVRETRWFHPYFVFFGVFLPLVALFAPVATVAWFASGEVAAGSYDLVILVLSGVPAYFMGRTAWKSPRRPVSQLIISPVGVLTGGGEARPVHVVPWDKITDVWIRPSGPLRRPVFVVRAKDIAETYRSLLGIRPGQPFTIYAIRASRLTVDRDVLATAVGRYSQGRLTLG